MILLLVGIAFTAQAVLHTALPGVPFYAWILTGIGTFFLVETISRWSMTLVRGIMAPLTFCLLTSGLVIIFFPLNPSHGLREGLAYTTTCSFIVAFLYLVSAVNPTLIGTFLFRFGEESDPDYWLAQASSQVATRVRILRLLYP